MYSDNNFEDLGFEADVNGNGLGSAGVDGGVYGSTSTFDINDFGLNSELFSDPSYHSSSVNNPLLQTIQRNTASGSSTSYQHHRINTNENDDPSCSSSNMTGMGIGNPLLGSPQPSTIKKLKSHLSGIGGIGGYLTSPMSSFRNTLNQGTPTLMKPTSSNSSNMPLVGSSPLKPILGHGSSQLQQQQHLQQQHSQEPACFDINTPLPPMPAPMPQYNNNHTNQQQHSPYNQEYNAPQMQRLQSAPAVSQASSSSSSNNPLQPTSGRQSRGSNRRKDNNSNNNDNLTVPHTATGATFNDMDYGGMRIYGRPLTRSASEDPSGGGGSTGGNGGEANGNSGSGASSGRKTKRKGSVSADTVTGGASFLPYPEQLPTVTLGRGVKNSRDVPNQSSHSSFPMTKSDSEPVPSISSTSTSSSRVPKPFTNLDKPFIQYVAPNSPAAKSAARNKKALTLRTDSNGQISTGYADSSSSTASGSGSGNNNEDNNSKRSGKMVAIRMPQHSSHHDMPLTPPISAHNINVPSPQRLNMQSTFPGQPMQTSYSQQQQQQISSHNENRSPYFSPVKNTYDFSHIPQLQYQNDDSTQQHQMPMSANMPSFEFSLEQFGNVGGGSQQGMGNPSHSQQQQQQHQGLSQYGIMQNTNGNDQYTANAIDFSSVLGLPSPHHQDSHSSAGSSNGGNLLSPPPPHSAASTHSSVFSDDQALLFGIPAPASPYFEESQSIEQALASLLGGATTSNNNNNSNNGSSSGIVPPSREHTLTPQPQLQMHNAYSPSHQQQQMFSPHPHQHQHQQQQQPHYSQQAVALGISSPPLSPNHGQMTSPAQPAWAPYAQQQQQQNSSSMLLPNIDPALQSLNGDGNIYCQSPQMQHSSHHLQQHQQQNLNMLSPQSAHHYQSGYDHHHQQQQHQQSISQQLGNGRPMSSPRRLRGMQSAPDLAGLYSDQSLNGFNDAFGITSSPRKVSLKRGRAQYGDDSDEENVQRSQYGGRNSAYDDDEDESSDLEGDDGDEYNNGYSDRPPPRKRANSVSSRGGKTHPSSSNVHDPVAAVLLPLVNPNPARLRPGPKPKTSLPNLQAAHQGVFQVSPRAPPVPAFPAQYLAQATSPNPSNAESSTAGGCLSPDPDTGFLRPQGGVSKEMLATFYAVGTGSKQTKKGKPQRMYICSIPGCEKEFPRKSAVESHIQTHLEDKPFACPYDGCGASFVRSHDLTRHVRIHSGSKPFQCVCGKGFARGDALTRHRQRGICEGSLVPRRW